MSIDAKAEAEQRLRESFAEFQAVLEQAMLEGVDVMGVMMGAGMAMPFPPVAGFAPAAPPAVVADAPAVVAAPSDS